MVHKKYDRRRILLAAAASLVIMAVLTFYLWDLTENIRLGYAIGRAESEIGALERDIRGLQVERETLSSPERVDKIARNELGLEDLRDDQIIYEKRR
jgi:cell division protein FtsL